MKNVIGNLVGIALYLLTALSRLVIFTILIFLIQEHGVSFHLFVSSLVSFISDLQFSAYNLLSL